VNALGGPLGFPVFEVGVLLFNRLEPAPLQGCGLGVADGVLNRAFAVGVTHAGRVAHHTIVFQCGSIDSVELGLVQVGFDDPLLEVVQHHVAAGTTEVAPSFFMQACPGFLTGFPHDPAKAAPGVTQGHYKQARLAKALGAGNTGECALAVIDLGFFAGGKFQTVKLLGFVFAQATAEAFDAVVGAGKTMAVDQVLVDGHVVALEAQLGFDEFPMGLAGGGR